MVSVRLQENNWSGSAVTQNLYTSANMPDLGVLLRVLDASPTVTGITVYRTITVPELTKLRQMTREELNIQEKDLVKVT
jgi:hypothetical protein